MKGTIVCVFVCELIICIMCDYARCPVLKFASAHKRKKSYSLGTVFEYDEDVM